MSFGLPQMSVTPMRQRCLSQRHASVTIAPVRLATASRLAVATDARLRLNDNKSPVFRGAYAPILTTSGGRLWQSSGGFPPGATLTISRQIRSTTVARTRCVQVSPFPTSRCHHYQSQDRFKKRPTSPGHDSGPRAVDADVSRPLAPLESSNETLDRTCDPLSLRSRCARGHRARTCTNAYRRSNADRTDTCHSLTNARGQRIEIKAEPRQTGSTAASA